MARGQWGNLGFANAHLGTAEVNRDALRLMPAPAPHRERVTDLRVFWVCCTFG